MILLAYIDPGLGLLAWQAAVAVFLGLLFYVRKTRTWIVGMVKRLFQPKKPPEAARTELPPPVRNLRQ